MDPEDIIEGIPGLSQGYQLGQAITGAQQTDPAGRSWVDQVLLGLGEIGLTLLFVALAMALIYVGLTRLFGARPLTSAVAAAVPG